MEPAKQLTVDRLKEILREHKEAVNVKEKDIERMYRNYRKCILKQHILQPKFVSVITGMPTAHDQNNNKVQDLAIERAENYMTIELVNLCLEAMTKDERKFIEYRYFDDMEIWVVLDNMPGWSRSQIYRLRNSVIAKTLWLLGKKKEKNILSA